MRKVKAEVKNKSVSKGPLKSKAKGVRTKVEAKLKATPKAKTTKEVKVKDSGKANGVNSKISPAPVVKKKDSELNRLIINGMQEKKALDITILDLTNIKNCVADYFILCSATSDIQVGAISDSIEEEIYKATKQDPWRKEGQENKEWVLLDYVDVVAHVFKKDKRQFYSLEELWGDATITHVE